MNARHYLRLLRENTILIGATVVGCLLVAGLVTVLIPKSYASSVTFYVVAGTNPGRQAGASDTYQGAQLSTDRIKSYIELITGPRVAQDAARAVGPDTSAADVQSKVAASSVANTVIITMTATDRSPAQAVAIASAVSNSFTQLVQQLETPNGVDQVPAVTAQVIQPPSVPGSPVSPLLKINLIIGLLVGLLLGFGVAVVRRALDVSVRSTDALEDTADAVVLGVVPEDESTARQAVSLAADAVVGSMADARTEAYRRIRTALEFANIDGTRRVLVVTSALPGDGRTVTACNLAAALAAVGSRVVLVEGDLRRPRTADYLGLDASAGLTGVLTGTASLDSALQRWSPGRFDVLASGRTSPRPSELLSSRRAAALIDELRSRYDFVLIDSPPILPVTDAANLGAHSDGAVVVCRWGTTSRPQVESAVSMLRSVSVPVVGTVLSRVPEKRGQRWTYRGTYSCDEAEQPLPTPDVAANGSPRSIRRPTPQPRPTP